MKAAEDQLTSRAGTKATPGMQRSIAGAALPGPGCRGGAALPRPGAAPPPLPSLPFPSLSLLRLFPAPDGGGEPGTAAGLSPLPASGALGGVCEGRNVPRAVSPSFGAPRAAHAPAGQGGGRRCPAGTARRALRVVPPACAFTGVFERAKNGAQCELLAARCPTGGRGGTETGSDTGELPSHRESCTHLIRTGLSFQTHNVALICTSSVTFAFSHALRETMP